ncbi:MAG: hypothetical protein HY598_05340 [Candidatus Omnitrophica bacterium]|nr:hypothetical protein [Candidatus Omnitrophota bacterium]
MIPPPLGIRAVASDRLTIVIDGAGAVLISFECARHLAEAMASVRFQEVVG